MLFTLKRVETKRLQEAAKSLLRKKKNKRPKSNEAAEESKDDQVS